MQTYNALAAAKLGGELLDPLIGICDRDNAAAGFLEHVEEPACVATGLPSPRINPPQEPKRINGAFLPTMKGIE